MSGQEKKSKTNLIYVVIGILTLVVAITGATFAYYTPEFDSFNLKIFSRRYKT